MNFDKLNMYELIKRQTLPELSSEGYLLEHKKTKSRILVMENDDDNKVFYIGFRTPPSDSYGTPHIMEHSVLCGSKLFPAKDPFVELAKGSLNTFLNAMTYPDKTVYPVASCNDTDFKNLMQVYMDAVFEPNIYERPQIFKQEGWHYELNEPDGEITINGVVYNEMKGAYSSADDMVDRENYIALFPDNAYAKDSGGNPDVIPNLTYEGFKEFHRTYYHPSNSYIYLYGNADMTERLLWLDEAYLSKYDYLSVDSELKKQAPFDRMKIHEFDYSVMEDEPLEDNTYFSYSCVIEDVLDKELYQAFKIIDYALLSAPGAPVREALIKAGIGQDIMSNYENGIYQPYFSIIAKNANKDDADAFTECIKNTLSDIVKNGIDIKAFEAGINIFDFKYREADFGQYPKGLMYGLNALDSWLYDTNEPFMHIEGIETLKLMKERLNTGYFEKLIDRYFLNNTHSVLVIARPVRGLASKKDAKLTQKLSELKSSMSKEELKALYEDTLALKKYQEEPSTPEELETIPMLSRNDLRKEIKPLNNKYSEENGIKYLFHELKSNGIGYLSLTFELSAVPPRLYPYLSLLKGFLGVVSTKNYTYGELFNEINRKSGGISSSVSVHNDCTDESGKRFHASLEMDSKFLNENTAFVFNMMEEILFTSDFDDHSRLKELLLMFKSRLSETMTSRGHSTASLRACSYFDGYTAFFDIMNGIEAYKFIVKLLDEFDDRKDELSKRLKECLSCILNKESLLIDFGGDAEGFMEVKKAAKQFFEKLSDKPSADEVFKPYDIELSKKNEGFKVPGMVQYVAAAGSFKDKGLAYTGALSVLQTVLSYDYLWINIRVKGGAYGCMSSFKRNGSSFLVSYRDPHLKETLDIYRAAAAYIKEFSPDERDITKYIIGTLGDKDIPLTPRMEADRSYAAFVCGLTEEMLQKERDELLAVDKEVLQGLAAYLEAICDADNICVVGTENAIAQNKDLFMKIEGLA